MGTLRERERENWLGGTALLAICCDGEWICIHTYRSELTVAEAVTTFVFGKLFLCPITNLSFCDASPHNPKRGPCSFTLPVASCDKENRNCHNYK